MVEMKDFLKLIRVPNLIVVAVTMYLMRYFILEPIAANTLVQLSGEGGNLFPMMLQMKRFDFGLLVFATVMITAGGYVINDYFDVKTDLINRGKVIVGTSISRRKAMMWHNLFNLLGIIGGFWVAYRSGHTVFGVLFLLVSGLLYFYSSTYKRQLLLGNIIVAILVAMVPMLVALFEIPLLFGFYSSKVVEMPDISIFFWWTGGFSFFAFLTTLTREIIKDIADFEGDKAYGRRTLPVVAGLKLSRYIVTALAAITVVSLATVWLQFFNDYISLVYLLATVITPLIVFIFIVLTSEGYKKMTGAGNILKLVMVAGLLYSVVVKFILHY